MVLYNHRMFLYFGASTLEVLLEVGFHCIEPVLISLESCMFVVNGKVWDSKSHDYNGSKALDASRHLYLFFFFSLFFFFTFSFVVVHVCMHHWLKTVT